jgi:hypothetical protein
MKRFLVLVAVLLVTLLSVQPLLAPAAADAEPQEPVGGRKWFHCALAVTLVVGGIATMQYHFAAAGAMVFPTACAMGW